MRPVVPLDDAARIVGQRLTEIWGQAVVVDNPRRRGWQHRRRCRREIGA
jgi:hypothetical protein